MRSCKVFHFTWSCEALRVPGLHRQVLLARQMEQSARDFAAWRRTREREVQQLRRAGRKQAAHVQKLEALQAKQAAVLRRKTEEAEAARRRLKVRLKGRPTLPVSDLSHHALRCHWETLWDRATPFSCEKLV